MQKLSTALCVALFALSGTASYAADEKKAEPAKQTAAKPADKAASAAPARGLGSGQEEGKEGRLLTRSGTAGSTGKAQAFPVLLSMRRDLEVAVLGDVDVGVQEARRCSPRP